MVTKTTYRCSRSIIKNILFKPVLGYLLAVFNSYDNFRAFNNIINHGYVKQALNSPPSGVIRPVPLFTMGI